MSGDGISGSKTEKELEPIFQNISAEQNVVEVESLCMQCREKGISRFLLTRIPHFRDIVIAAFECPNCGYSNNSVQSATAIAEKGVKYSCLITTPEDLNRQVVISEHATVFIEELSLEIPSNHKEGRLSTIEGILRRILEDLQEGQKDRKISDIESFEKIQQIIKKIEEILNCHLKCTITLDDPSGNSYIENLCAPKADPHIKIFTFKQTPQQLLEMGYSIETNENDNDNENENVKGEISSTTTTTTMTPESVYSFQSNCSSCSSPCETRMHLVDIPHFREVIIMATNCDYCGYRTNEVKSGGAISSHGKKIILKLVNEEDLNRDILKSETCTLEIPEIDLHLTTGALGGRFTTLEGFLHQVRDELNNKLPFFSGDSAHPDRKIVFSKLLENLDKICSLQLLPCTVILDDPISNSYLQNIYAPDDDPNMIIEDYERTFEQNEELGLNDIKVEGYESI